MLKLVDTGSALGLGIDWITLNMLFVLAQSIE